MQIIGTCGDCGGRVVVPTVWLGIYPPVPGCDKCGKKVRCGQLPVLEMDQTAHKGKWTWNAD